ncbi:general transcription factor IIH subunit 2-like [Centruroides sculpturatus]|uniref:general transcription factor IIH subunit 2-like n=1 Tax=Centruroides sculpturatus TaxID=218467 RepID=UPI000C6E1FEB|nr:general transcription factor IIH subunit 2-like [Centruroides sculpturatus]
MAEDEDPKGYRWETEYEKTWEAIRENEEGLLQPSVEEYLHHTKRRRLLEKKNVRLGMMRHLYIVIDMSENMSEQDLKPTRQLCTLKILEGFVEEYFDQNPISQLGFIITKNKRADKISELSGNPKQHINVLKNASEMVCAGEPSIQNALELSSKTLRNMPGHTSREVLIIMGSLTTCDPGNIYTTIETMKMHNIRCSVIGLAAELRVCRALTNTTAGSYHVILDESHFKELVNLHTVPPPAAGSMESCLIRMGFPHHQTEAEGTPSICFCHLNSKDPSEGFGSAGYYCPQCHAKYCELPVECKACGLTLVSAPHLARSYHHLFPLNCFQEVALSALTEKDSRNCFACLADFKEQLVYRCENCRQLFCLECDLFVHDTLHTCPGCANNKLTNMQT